MNEHKLQCSVAEYLDRCLPKNEALWFAVPNGGKRGVVTAANLKKEGVKAGVADIIVIWRGSVIAIEMKTPKGAHQTIQKQWGEALTLAGGVYVVCRSLRDVWAALDAAGVPMGGKPT